MIDLANRIASRVEITNLRNFTRTRSAKAALLFDCGGRVGLVGRKHPLLPCTGSRIVMETGDDSIGRRSVGRSNKVVYGVVE